MGVSHPFEIRDGQAERQPYFGAACTNVDPRLKKREKSRRKIAFIGLKSCRMAEPYVFPRNLNHGEHLFPEINYNPQLKKNLSFVNNFELNIARIKFKSIV